MVTIKVMGQYGRPS